MDSATSAQNDVLVSVNSYVTGDVCTVTMKKVILGEIMCYNEWNDDGTISCFVDDACYTEL